MKHAGSEVLKLLGDLLAQIRTCELTEPKPGIFYLGRTAFLHFHEDAAGIFADIKIGSKFERYPVSNRTQQQKLLKLIRRQLG